MTRTLRSALVLVALAVSALPLGGCAITQNGDTTTLQPATRYNGTPATAPVDYAAGEAVSIVSHNGNVTVHPGGGAQLSVTFSPFTMDAAGKETSAASEMANYLVFNAKPSNGVITIEAVIKQGGSGVLGADIDVTLPASFNGAFMVTSANGEVTADLGATNAPTSTNIDATNGSVKVSNAQGQLKVNSRNGAVDVDVAAWSAEAGAVSASNGNVDFKVPTATDGALTATASGTVTGPSPLPTSWKEAVAAANSKSYTMGAGASATAGTVALTTSFGDVTITAK